VVLGDTELPLGPVSGGSWATASVVPAVFAAADNAISSLLQVATTTPGSPFEKRKPDDLAFQNGRVFVKADAVGGGVPFADLLKRANLRLISGSGRSEGIFGSKEKPKFSMHSFGCHFVEVTWQPEIARLRVNRVVTVIDGGPHYQSTRRPQPNRRRRRDGHRHGDVGAHDVRPAKRRAD